MTNDANFLTSFLLRVQRRFDEVNTLVISVAFKLPEVAASVIAGLSSVHMICMCTFFLVHTQFLTQTYTFVHNLTSVVQ